MGGRREAIPSVAAMASRMFGYRVCVLVCVGSRWEGRVKVKVKMVGMWGRREGDKICKNSLCFIEFMYFIFWGRELHREA